jgi:hypothetical protein
LGCWLSHWLTRRPSRFDRTCLYGTIVLARWSKTLLIEGFSGGRRGR